MSGASPPASAVDVRVDRSLARLGNSAAATAWLASLGLDHAFARRIGMGLDQEDDHGLVISHACRDRQGLPRTVRHRIDADGRISPLTSGGAAAVWSSEPTLGGHVLVLPSLILMWQLMAAVDGDLSPFVAVAPSHGGGLPIEWRDEAHWRDFVGVTLILDDVFSQGALLSAIGSACRGVADVASAPDADRWADAVRRPVGFRRSDLATAVARALPVALFLGASMEAARHQADRVDVHGLDGEGRAMRVVRVEERLSGPAGERVRCRDLVVRSDGMLLEVSVAAAPPGTPVRDRVVTLSDGTRLERAPGSASRWSLASIRRFLSEADGGLAATGGDALLEAVEEALAASTGLRGDAVRLAAGFVMLTHVHRLHGQLRVPVFHGSTPAVRSRLIGSVARLAHGGSVHSRARGDVLATTAIEVGGAVLLDEPGPLAGPAGATEVGRFVLASSFADAVWDRSSGSGPRTRSVFGPRAVFAQRAPSTSLGGVELLVELEEVGAVVALDERVLANLADRLHVWSMRVFRRGTSLSAADPLVSDAIRQLTALDAAEAAGTGTRPVGLDGERLMAEAMEACTRHGPATLSITHLLLELTLRGGVGPEFSPERVGRWLAASGLLEPGTETTRRRLHGHISRTYRLAGSSDPAAESGDPFAFCSASRCAECRFVRVCEAVAPGMAACKSRGR